MNSFILAGIKGLNLKLGLKGENENISYFNEKNTMGSISMRSMKFG
jgi:hypothetical protein